MPTRRCVLDRQVLLVGIGTGTWRRGIGAPGQEPHRAPRGHKMNEMRIPSSSIKRSQFYVLKTLDVNHFLRIYVESTQIDYLLQKPP